MLSLSDIRPNFRVLDFASVQFEAGSLNDATHPCEAPAWPNFNRTIANWMAVKDRGFASSLPLAGGGLGAAITPPFIAWVMLTYGWKESFYASAGIGIVAALVWYSIARDTPEKHPWVNSAELRAIHGRESAHAQSTAGRPQPSAVLP